jgi:amino acid transporter
MSYFNDAQVNYLLKRPKFFVLSFYAINYIVLASSAANALSFGDDIIGDQGTDRGAARDAAARGLAIVAVTFPCFLHAFTRRGGIILNNIFAMTKVAILCTFPIMAVCVLAGVVDSNHAKENLNMQNSFSNGRSDVDSYTQGILAVLYAYSGYNQANYVCEHRLYSFSDLADATLGSMRDQESEEEFQERHYYRRRTIMRFVHAGQLKLCKCPHYYCSYFRKTNQFCRW